MERLRQVVPEFAATQNPVDVTGYILVDRNLQRNALTAVHDDPGLDALVLVSDLPRAVPPDPALIVEMYRATAAVLREMRKPVIVMGNTLTDITPVGRDVASQTGYPGVLGGIHHGLTALGRAVRWSALYRAAARRAVPQAVGQQAAQQTPGAAVARLPAEPDLAVQYEPGSSWTEYRAAAFLAEHGIPVVPGLLVTDPRSARRRTPPHELGYPVVLKLAADGIEHKSDIGGVRVGLRDAAEVGAAYADVARAGREAGADVRGALVQPMRADGIELLVGIVTDPVWGQVLAVGLGGIFVEILRDTAVRVLPVDRDQVLQSLQGLRGARLFDGPRGTEKADLDAVADAIAAAAALAGRLGDRLEALEINPLLVRGSQVEALDTLLTPAPARPAPLAPNWTLDTTISAMAPQFSKQRRVSGGTQQHASLCKDKSALTLFPGSGPAPAETQRALLDAAREVFTEQGFAGASIADVVRRAGSSVGSLYHHFGGKSELFVALWHEHQAAYDQAAGGAVAEARRAGVTDPFELFSVGARAYLEGSWDRRDLAMLFLSGDSPPGFEVMVRRRGHEWLAQNDALLRLSESSFDRLYVTALTSIIGEGAREVAGAGTRRQANKVIDATLEYIRRLMAGGPWKLRPLSSAAPPGKAWPGLRTNP